MHNNTQSKENKQRQNEKFENWKKSRQIQHRGRNIGSTTIGCLNWTDTTLPWFKVGA